MLGEVALERVHALGGEILDPGLGEIVLDAVQKAAFVHGGIIDPGADVHMSRSAHSPGRARPSRLRFCP